MMLTYKGNLFARPDAELLSPEDVMVSAGFWRLFGMSGGMTYKQIEAEIYTYHEGDLFNARDDWLDPDNLRPSQLWPENLLNECKTLNRMRVDLWGDAPWEEVRFEMGDLFGRDRRGTMNKFMRFATRPPENALAEFLSGRFMFIDFARSIRAGRLNLAYQ